MNKKIIISSLALVLLAGISTHIVRNAYADEESRNLPPFVQGFVERFNLNEDEVTTYFEEQKQYRMENRGEGYGGPEARLDQAVEDGLITEEQKALLIERREEHRAQSEAEREEHRAEFESWAQENGIDTSVLPFGEGRKGPGMGKRMQQDQ